ncbi:hypothetical protein KSF73_08225 [Burkholderiaceae bacterium DAT-1]|nr:hypothetical protein [Burkholderiaceae bacterium DAT-1]
MPIRKIEPISNFLPVRFKRGGLVKQFSKPCVRCGRMLHASEMRGVVRLIDDHLALAADAFCPSCHTRFGVACVIDSEKRVRRVALPAWLFRWYLRIMPMQQGEVELGESMRAQIEVVEKLAEAVQAAQAVDYPRAETMLGRYQDKPIPAYIVVDGQEVPFDRIEPDGRVGAGEYLLDGCFVYKTAQ